MTEVHDKAFEGLMWIDAIEAELLERANQRICLSSKNGGVWQSRRLSKLLDTVISHIASLEGWRSIIALTDCLAALVEVRGTLEVHWYIGTAFPMFGGHFEDVWRNGPVIHFCDGIQLEWPQDH